MICLSIRKYEFSYGKKLAMCPRLQFWALSATKFALKPIYFLCLMNVVQTIVGGKLFELYKVTSYRRF